MPIGELGGYLLGELFTQDEQRRRRELEEAALQDMLGLEAPTLSNVGVADIGKSAYEDVETDPSLVSAQQEALVELMQRGREGFNAEDKSVLNRILGEASAQERGARQAIQARGRIGSGQSMALQQMAAQSAADRASQAGTDWAAQSRRAALDSIASGAGLAGQMRSQQGTEDARKAEARDRFRMYGVQAQQAANYYNAGLPQRMFENEARVRRARAGARTDRAGQVGRDIQRTQQGWVAGGRTVDNGLQASLNAFQAATGAGGMGGGVAQGPAGFLDDEDKWGEYR